MNDDELIDYEDLFADLSAKHDVLRTENQALRTQLETLRVEYAATSEANIAFAGWHHNLHVENEALRTQLEELRTWVNMGEALQMEFLFAPTTLGMWWERRPKDSA